MWRPCNVGTTWIISRGKDWSIEGFSSQTMDWLTGVWRQWTEADAELDTVLEWCSVEGSSEVMVVLVPVLAEDYAIDEKALTMVGQKFWRPAHCGGLVLDYGLPCWSHQSRGVAEDE